MFAGMCHLLEEGPCTCTGTSTCTKEQSMLDDEALVLSDAHWDVPRAAAITVYVHEHVYVNVYEGLSNGVHRG